MYPKFISRVMEIIIFMSAAMIMYLTVDVIVPPVTSISLTVLNSKLMPGDAIKYESVWERRSSCRVEIQRFVIKVDDIEEVFHRDSVPGMPLGNGLTRNVSYLQPSKELIPGNYALRVYVMSSCNLISRVSQYPEARFEVVSR